MAEHNQVLFGLGVGLLLSGLLIIIFPPPRPTEIQTIDAARRLGMVFRDEVLLTYQDNSDEVLRGNLGFDLVGSGIGGRGISSGGTDQSIHGQQKTEIPKEPGNHEQITNSKQQKTDTKQQEPDAEDTDEKLGTTQSVSEYTYSTPSSLTVEVTIPRGSVLTKVADILGNAGVVDPSDFLERAGERKVSQKIIAGKYQVPAGSNVDKVINIITTP